MSAAIAAKIPLAAATALFAEKMPSTGAITNHRNPADRAPKITPAARTPRPYPRSPRKSAGNPPKKRLVYENP